MEKYVALKTCFWGPTPGTQTMYPKDTVILAHGNEPNLLEFFEPAEKVAPAPKPVAKPKPGPKPKLAPVEDLNDL